MGRPSKLTPETAAKIVEALELGTTIKVASRFGGVNPATFARWMVAAKSPNASAELCKFRDQVRAAIAGTEVQLLRLHRGHMAESYQPVQWMLERRFPKRYGARNPADAVPQSAGLDVIKAALEANEELERSRAEKAPTE